MWNILKKKIQRGIKRKLLPNYKILGSSECYAYIFMSNYEFHDLARSAI